MSNTKKIASIAFTGAAATAATMMAVGPALAAASWEVKSGANLYTGKVTGKLKTGTTAVLKDTTKNTTLTCKKAIFSGTVSKSKSPLAPPPKQLGFLKKTVTTWSSCTGPAGLTFKAHLTTSPGLIASGFNAASDVVTGKIATNKVTGAKISGVISGTGLFNTCKATISGSSVPLKLLNNPRSFNVNSGKAVTLHVKSTAGFCANAINTSDKAYFTGTYHVSVPSRFLVS